MKKTITLKEIAKLAGVSRGTVDRAINNRGKISPEKRDKIIEIAKKHGYVKNVIASSLAKNINIYISVVLPDPIQDNYWQSPVDGIKQLEVFIKNYGINLHYHFFDINDSSSFASALKQSIQNKPNAILTAPIFLKEARMYFKIAEQNNIPFVCINSEIDHSDILCYIGQNSIECGQVACKLFDNVINDRDEIIVLTLGHHTDNAIHINNKVGGLKEYNRRNKCNYKIIDYVIEDYNNAAVLDSFVKKILKRKDHLRGVFFTNSRAHKFLNQTNFLDELDSKVCCIGFDLLPQNIELLETNKLNYILNQNPYRQGYLGIVNLFNHFIHQRKIPKRRYLPVDIIVKENYKSYLDENNYRQEIFV